MIPKELCHYTKKDIALEKILFSKKIKLGQLGFTNDPKESKPKELSLFSDPHERLHSFHEIVQEAKRVSKEEWKVLCMTETLSDEKGKNVEGIDIGKFFTSGYSRPRMWAQYADNHTGVCLIFDGFQLHKNITNTLKNQSSSIFHGLVNYQNVNSLHDNMLKYDKYIKPYGLTEGIRKYYLDKYKKYFLSKYADWQNETEYRWLIHSPANSPEFIPITGALTNILVGVDFPKVYNPTLIELCKELNVSAGRMDWIGGTPFPDLTSIYEAN